MKRIVKQRHEMSIDELIADAGWFPGDERDWKAEQHNAGIIDKGVLTL